MIKMLSGKNELYYRDKIRPFTYPPFAAFIFQPLHIIPLTVSSLILFLMNALVLLPLAIYLIYRILKLAWTQERLSSR